MIKNNTKIVTLATKTFAVAGPLIADLDKAIKSRGFSDMPAMIQSSLKASHEGLKAMVDSSNKVLASHKKAALKNTALDELTFTIQQVSEATKSAKDALTTFTKMSSLIPK